MVLPDELTCRGMSTAETSTPARRRTGGTKRPRAKEEDGDIGAFVTRRRVCGPPLLRWREACAGRLHRRGCTRAGFVSSCCCLGQRLQDGGDRGAAEPAFGAHSPPLSPRTWWSTQDDRSCVSFSHTTTLAPRATPTQRQLRRQVAGQRRDRPMARERNLR